MIELNNITFSYGDKQILKNFCLNIKDGSRICLYGNSGIGKTTITRLILGLEKPKKGTVICTSNNISVVFQEDRLLPFKTLRENIILFGNCEKADYIMSALRIDDAKDKYPSELSGGMSRRAAIARALSVDADIYILDEPFTGLDKDNTLRTINLINEITKGKTLITVMHEKYFADLLNCKILTIPAQ